jgi:hypothetical protein
LHQETLLALDVERLVKGRNPKCRIRIKDPDHLSPPGQRLLILSKEGFGYDQGYGTAV